MNAAAHHVVIYTDGGCAPANPGPGGWGAILIKGAHQKELKGGEPHTTNNRMELMAAISALEALKQPCVVDMHTDSQYVRDGITKYINSWKRNGWRTADEGAGEEQGPVGAARGRAQRPHGALALGAGHSGDQFNERADELVREARDAVRAGSGRTHSP